ncbi:coiled-coil-helix-coiled-coil-helix domain-containing protein 1 [Lampris incognitus]|uniref:coiled-coil-helix-coiled-coil-helix domain-containing protein 1 n=1 Tax=Lampris incognitus TaxID=2546036 RepID=UPI0024B5E2A0|nr:coiled-coil-helix-coiled-coil-helix domain-containing protein 1 [Lampris incognitus]
MAAQVGVNIQEKVSRLLNRQNGKPVLKPNKPLILNDTVANRKMKKGEATCITELNLMMACWKQNNFVDQLCSNEMQTFYTCVQKAQAKMKDKSEHGGPQKGRFPSKQATSLLKRFPNLHTEV